MGKTAFMFPGQGSQHTGMGKDLYEASPSAKYIFDLADEVLNLKLSELCWNGPDETLTLTVNAQPALLTVSVAVLAAMKEELGDVMPVPDFVAGHSLGEYSALVAAGAVDFKTAVSLARERGRLMFEAGNARPGAMASIIAMSREDVQAVCDETKVYVANYNCPGQIAISGDKKNIRDARKLAKERGAKLAIPLQVSGAFHSPMMQPAAEALTPQIEAADIRDARVPVIANVTALPICHEAEIKHELSHQVVSSVHWEESVRYMISEGVDTFYEIGSGTVLAGLMKRIDPKVRVVNVGTMEDVNRLAEELRS